MVDSSMRQIVVAWAVAALVPGISAPQMSHRTVVSSPDSYVQTNYTPDVITKEMCRGHVSAHKSRLGLPDTVRTVLTQQIYNPLRHHDLCEMRTHNMTVGVEMVTELYL